MSIMDFENSSRVDDQLNPSWISPYPKGPIPTYTIDLDLPPRERYVQLSTDFGPKMRSLVPLFDNILSWIIPLPYPRRFIRWLLSILMRRVFSSEETEEIKGVSESSGVDLFIVVALNVLLDSLLGCTSGAVLVRGKKGKTGERAEPRMMHFRTLDWGMDGLKNLLVTLEFVRSKSSEPDKVIARSITYAGFVGVLTGVRQDLSISLNFRPVRSCSIISLRIHQLLVLLGRRSSIASHLRQALLPPKAPPSLFQTVKTLTRIKSSPCYLILCSGEEVTVMERDLKTFTIRNSTEFIVHTNHDQNHLSSTSNPPAKTNAPAGIDLWIEDSEDRAECIAEKWAAVKSKYGNAQAKTIASYYGLRNREDMDGSKPSIVEETLINWVKTYPTMNESSHFGCVMDPSTGTVRMLERDGFKKYKNRPKVVLTMSP